MVILSFILMLLIIVIIIESYLIKKLIKMYRSVLKYSNYLEDLCDFKDIKNDEF
ncbi:MAG: hypothetical protein E6094_00480 [Clostridium perfringens]|nr:hypothetical protein [Clostridium perfringens]